jgi:hypothetical protein
MFRHVVMFEWVDGVDNADIDAMADALDALVATVPEVASYVHGPDVGISEGNFDYVIVGEYASVEDYVVYRDHPEHQRIIAELVKPHVAKRAAVQFQAD